MTRLRELTVLIVGNTNTGSAPLRAFRFLYTHRIPGRLTYIGHPLAEERVRRSEFRHFDGAAHGPDPSLTVRRERSMGMLSYAVDILLTVSLLLRLRVRHDVYIATSLHLALLGLILRAAGIVRRTVFWTLDYFPHRSPNQFVNAIFLRLDRICTRRSDYVWNLTHAMEEARRERGIQLDYPKMYVVPHPIEEDEFQPLLPGEPEREPESLLYSGLVGPEYGFGLLVEALPLVLKKRPEVRVTVTTYGDFPTEWVEALRERGLLERFRILGYVSDRQEYLRVVRRHSIGLATYRPDPLGYKQYADVSRVKTYLAAGLPVVITRVPPIAKEIEARGAGVVIQFNKEQLADAILELLSDREFYMLSSAQALQLASEYRVDAILRRAFEPMGVTFS